jgi:hypothetical protein
MLQAPCQTAGTAENRAFPIPPQLNLVTTSTKVGENSQSFAYAFARDRTLLVRKRTAAVRRCASCYKCSVRRLATIGYEAKTQAEFLDELDAAGIELVLDVRAIAASRRPGFSKTALAGALRERGIDYLHLRAWHAGRGPGSGAQGPGGGDACHLRRST